MANSHVAHWMNLGRFNDFLRTLCEERDVELVDDRWVSGLDAPCSRIRFLEGLLDASGHAGHVTNV